MCPCVHIQHVLCHIVAYFVITTSVHCTSSAYNPESSEQLLSGQGTRCAHDTGSSVDGDLCLSEYIVLHDFLFKDSHKRTDFLVYVEVRIIVYDHDTAKMFSTMKLCVSLSAVI